MLNVCIDFENLSKFSLYKRRRKDRIRILVRMHASARERGVKMGPGNCLPLVDVGTRE